MVFDDSFYHEAMNASDKPRVVLIVDVWHPDLSDEEVTDASDFCNSVSVVTAAVFNVR